MDGELQKWPTHVRLVVTLTVGFELWKGSPSPFFYSTPESPGQPDLLTSSWAQYAGNAGIPRLIRIFDKHDVKATVALNGAVAEKYPQLVKKLVDHGHEIAAHSYVQDEYPYLLDPTQERLNIQKTVSAIEKSSGKRPVGWLSPALRRGSNTLKLLVDEGFTWCADFADHDVPYPLQVDGKEIAAIPYQFEINDYQLYMSQGNLPRSYTRLFKDTFDYMYEEGKTWPRMINATVHGHVFGRPFGAHALEEVIIYAKSHSGVRFARRMDIAKWLLEGKDEISQTAS